MRRVLTVISVALVAAGCADRVTGPNQSLPEPVLDQTPSGCVSDGACTLEPIIVIGDPGSGGGWGGGGGGGGGGDAGDPGGGACPTSSIAADSYVQSCTGGGEVVEPDPPPPDTCITQEPAINDPNVHGKFDDLWSASVAEGVEKGGWIVQEGSGFRLIPFQNATFTPCGIDLYESPPTGTVSIVHTHPWPLWTVTPCGYLNTGTPSEEDVAALQQTGVATGYFLDANAIGKFTATGGMTAIRIGRCGY